MSWREQPRDRLGRWTDFLKAEYIYSSEPANYYLDGNSANGVPTPITDNAIANIPLIHPNGYTLEQAYIIREQHRELLRYARENNNGNEVAFVFREGLTDRSIIHGDATSVNMTYALGGKGYNVCVMHNHPTNRSFSANDITTFIHFSELKTVTIVKHNGGVEVISKSDSYDKEAFKTEFRRNLKRYAKANDTRGIDKAIKQTLLKNGGMVEWKESY